MSAHSPDAIRRSLRLYAIVGLLLFCGTGATVAVATIPWLDVGGHGFDHADMRLGLLIASVKALLVAMIFMHLNHERRLIYWLIGLAAVHCSGMALFILLAENDPIHDPLFYMGDRPDARTTPSSGWPYEEATPTDGTK
jgi:hypothetical protein